MESSNFPRWAPSPSPSRLLLSPVEDHDIKSSAAGTHGSAEDGVSLSCSTMERIFPFSVGFRSTSTGASTAYASAVETSLEAENAFSVDQRITDATHVVELDSKEETGISLTWEDLWVGVGNGRRGQKMILQGLTGYVQPGEVLAIMGPSGCGKSTLLDTLAGRLKSSAQLKGKILINGRRETLVYGNLAYVTQDDTLMTTLTVREVMYYSAQLQLPNSMSKAEKKERAETTIKEMGLQGCMDTRIGGWGRSRLSGGQKRRVSICIEILTRPQLLFLDEPTSGLDSAASYHVMNHIIKLAHRDARTVISSIHQPSNEIFEIFQNLCLLSAGRTVYFGPASQAEQFFASNGFPCPSLRNPTDHYMRIINKDFDIDIEQGLEGETSTEGTIQILINSYKSSGISKQLELKVTEICNKKGRALQTVNQASFITQCLVLTKRSFINMYRDLGYYWLRLVIYVGLCLCLGTIYYGIGSTINSIQDRANLLMFVGSFLTFMAIGGFSSFVEEMKVFQRERLSGHYGVAAFVVGNSFSSIPYLLMNSFIPGAIVYFLVGLQHTFDHFAYFALQLLVTLMLVESVMMIVASIVPDFLLGVITGSGVLGVMLLVGGFYRKPHDLPHFFWKYPMYYIGFYKYVLQGFYKNEFEGRTFPNNQAGGPLILTGEEILKNNWQTDTSYSKWVDIATLFGMVIVYRIIFFGTIKLSEKVTPIIKAFIVRVTVES